MAQPLTDAITALTRYANETTGQSDPDLSSAVRTLCDGYGGGATPFELLEEITVTEATRAVNIDTSGYLQDYQYLMVMADLTLSKSDYVYTAINKDTPTTSGGGWFGTLTELQYPLLFVLHNRTNAQFMVLKPKNSGSDTSVNVADVTNLYINTYASNTTIAVGSKFTVYGAKFAEM